MGVAFNQVPTNVRVPLFWAEVNSGLSFFAGNSKLLLIGQKLASGTAAANVPQILQLDDIETRFGAGSMLIDMIRVAKKTNGIGEIWALPLADPAGTAAVWTATIAGTLTPGVAVLYIAGRRIEVSVTAADTVTTVATALAAAINAGWIDLDGRTYLHPVSATSNLGVVTLTARNVGEAANSVGIETDRIGDEGPNAALITVAVGAAGVGAPSLTAGLAGCGDIEFDMIAFPYPDATSLNSMRDFLADRWAPMKQLYGGAFAANLGNLSAQSTLGAGRNDPNVHIMGYNGSPTPTWIWAAAIGAQVQAHKNLGADLTQAGEISRPMHTLILPEVLPPKDIAKRWAKSDLQTLYYDGISGYHVTPDGQVAINRLISTYQTNAWGSPDATWLDVETRYQTAYALRYLKQVVTSTYPRSALVPDNPGNLQGFTTPTDIKSTVIHAYSRLVDAGIAKNKQLFADNLIVEQASDPNRVNCYMPLDVANQLRIFAVNATTFLNAANV